MKILFAISLFIFVITNTTGQTVDSTINNLIHPYSYRTSELGAIPEYVKIGHGKIPMILIPGLGFDFSVFSDFMNANENNYTMYAITIPGFGKTAAPPMPPEGTSYGQYSWTKGVLEGINKLISKEKIHKPIIVGHFTYGTQIALRMGIDYPEIIGGIIILGGPAKMIATMGGEIKEFPLDKMIYLTDNYSGPVWFKSMNESDWDDGNYLPEIYSLDSVKGKTLWNQVSEVPLPVMIRYLCEFIAMDIKLELGKIKCPVLILRATFNEKIIKDPINLYLSPQFIESWNSASETNSLIQVKDVPTSATFVWKDNPQATHRMLKEFIDSESFSNALTK